MVRIYYRHLLLVALLYSNEAKPLLAVSEELPTHSAEEDDSHQHGSHRECSLPTSTKDIIDCAMLNHPKVRRQQYSIESRLSLSDRAQQSPNPSLSSRFINGLGDESSKSELEANLAFTVELGAKQEARMALAKAAHQEAIASMTLAQAKVKIETILKLHRLRQLKQEINLNRKSLQAFSNLIRQLQKLPRLSPDMEASLALLNLALEEASLKEAELKDEQRSLEHYFHIATGHSLEEIDLFLPGPVHTWPSLSADLPTSSLSPSLKFLESQTQAARKELAIEKSKAWSDLSIGPSILIESEGSARKQHLGFNLQVEIPLMHRNDGAISHARSVVGELERSMQLAKAEERHERFEMLMIYRNAVESLERSVDSQRLDRTQRRLESLYERGLISGDTLIQSIQQKLEYLISRHRRELTAIEALWSVYLYDGSVLEMNL